MTLLSGATAAWPRATTAGPRLNDLSTGWRNTYPASARPLSKPCAVALLRLSWRASSERLKNWRGLSARKLRTATTRPVAGDGRGIDVHPPLALQLEPASDGCVHHS